MTPYTLNNKEVLVVDVPKGQRYFDLYGGDMCTSLVWNEMWYPGKFNRISLDLPPGSWSILGRGSELTEEQAKGLVEWYEDSNDSSYDPQYNVTTRFEVFKDYSENDDDFDNAIESFHSWLRSIGKEPETSLVLINEK